MKYLMILFLPVFLTACGKRFDTETVMSIRTGMSSTQIQSMFGNPTSIRVTVCGSEPKEYWECAIWRYGYSATFWFGYDENGELYLGNYDIDM